MTITSYSPQAPSDLVAEAPEATPADVAEAARRARAAQVEWWAPPGAAAARSSALRAAADTLRARADEATDLCVREVGKPRGEAAAEVARATSILDYYAEACFDPLGETYPPSADGLLYTERRPHGVAGLVTPWNFPLAIPLWKAAPALACGNAVLLKPSPEAIGCARLVGEILGAHLPEGLFGVVAGGAETGQAVVAEADVVSFTGSVAVGREVAVAAARRGVAAQCEMGGQNAAIVLPDADLAATATVVAAAAMGYAGQKCTATRRVIAVGDESRCGDVTDAMAAAVQALETGDPARAGTTVGPVINEAAFDRVLGALEEVGRDEGRLVVGGDRIDGDGWFVRPALADHLAPDHRLCRTETFGPLAVVLAAADVGEAVAMANSVDHGLVTSVHGRDVTALLAAVAGIDTGLVKVNAPTTGVDFYAPFGGEKASSVGPREQGKAALDFYASTRTVTFAAHPG